MAKLTVDDLAIMRDVKKEAKKYSDGMARIAALSVGPQEKKLIKRGLLVCYPSKNTKMVYLGLSGFAEQLLKRAKRG